MKSLLVSDKISLNYKDNKLIVNGKEYLPNEIDFTDIFVDRILEGYVTVKALRFLAKNNINLHIQEYSGNLIGSYQSFNNLDGKMKIAQLKAHEDSKRCQSIAESIVEAKIKAQHGLLLELSKHYDIETEYNFKHDLLLTYEGRYAQFYFAQLGKIFNLLYPEFHFKGRNDINHNYHSSDPINAMLNFSYSVISAITLRQINYYGLLPDISYLHYLSNNKQSLVFDLMEYMRPIADLSVIQTLETKKIDWKDFAYSEMATCRLLPNVQSLLMGNLQILLNSMIDHRQIETTHRDNISRFSKSLLKGSAVKFDVVIPHLYDSENIIERLKNMTIQERKKLGIRKNTLWYIQQNLKKGKKIKVYPQVVKKLEVITKK